MKRRLFNILAVVSLVVLLAIVALWVRSYYYRDIYNFGVEGGDSHTAQSILGRFHLLSHLSGGRASSDSFYSADRLSPNAIWNGGMSGYPPRPQWRGALLWQNYDEWTWKNLPPGVRPIATKSRLIVIPYWFPAAFFALLPSLKLVTTTRSHLRKRQLIEGQCLDCGYNLTGNLSGVCPECGTAIPPAVGSRQQAAKEGSA